MITVTYRIHSMEVLTFIQRIHSIKEKGIMDILLKIHQHFVSLRRSAFYECFTDTYGMHVKRWNEMLIKFIYFTI